MNPVSPKGLPKTKETIRQNLGYVPRIICFLIYAPVTLKSKEPAFIFYKSLCKNAVLLQYLHVKKNSVMFLTDLTLLQCKSQMF